MLGALHQLEIAWVIFIQSLGAWLAVPLQAVTMLGSEEFYMIVMPSLYWCFDAVLGFRVAIMLLLTNGFNAVFKLAFHSPRPFWVNQGVRPMMVETSFGIPSGHAQHAMSIWGLVGASQRSSRTRVVFIALILLIGFSRIYLGMHFVSDVLVGWLIGGLLLFGYLKLERPVTAWLRNRSYRQMLALAAVTSVMILLAILLTTASLGSWQAPDAWKQTLQITQPGGVIDPLNADGAFTTAGTWFGLMVGVAWYYHRAGRLFDAAGTPNQRLLRYVIGVIGVLVLWYGLGKVFPRSADTLSYALRFLRYTLVGLWVSAIAPRLFERIGLAEAGKRLIPSLSANQNPL